MSRFKEGGVVVVLSGGMDSAVLLYAALQEFEPPVLTVTFDYGQRHRKEIHCAVTLASGRSVENVRVDLSRAGAQVMGGSSQTDPNVPVPHGHYEDESMKQTVVPNRNAIMLSLAMGLAISRGINTVAYGAHSGDHAIYPDCRPEFVKAMQQVGACCHYTQVCIWTPFMADDKAGICQAGIEMGVPFEKTWTCYEGGDVACGKCGSCQERLEAFKVNGVEDPIPYVEGVTHG